MAGIVFLRFGYRLIPRDRSAEATIGDALDIKGYVTEATVVEGSPAVGESVDEFCGRHEGEVSVTSVLRVEGLS